MEMCGATFFGRDSSPSCPSLNKTTDNVFSLFAKMHTTTTVNHFEKRISLKRSLMWTNEILPTLPGHKVQKGAAFLHFSETFPSPSSKEIQKCCPANCW